MNGAKVCHSFINSDGKMTRFDNLTDIREVKAGESGSGLLIERDGHIIANSDTVKQINEDIGSNKQFVIPDHFVVSAVFQKYGIKNANGRIYPEDVLRREVDRYIKERVETRCAVGSLDHPSSSALSGHDISHNILNLNWEGRTLVGEMELHLSPGFRRYGVCSTSGDLVACMLIDNLLVGVSSRALGSVEKRFDALYVGDDLDLVCWDVVLEPSTSSAYIKRTREELTPYIESRSKSGDSLMERIKKVDSILRG